MYLKMTNKVIDDFHLSNHRDQSCKQKYSTETLRQTKPDLNTFACEQTFTWLSRQKHSLCDAQDTLSLLFAQNGETPE